MNRRKRTLFFICLTFPVIIKAQDTVTYYYNPVVVTATRVPTLMRFVNRSIDVIGEHILTNSALTSIEDVLQRSANVNVQSRGVFGVQTDMSIRGTLFSQNAVLLNGARIDDPQTAHYNFNLPISMDMIERVEILRGPGSAQYGANAFGGVVNLITKSAEQTSIFLRATGGQNGLMGGSLQSQFSGSSLRSINSFSYKKSDGYHEDTDFSLASISTSNEIDLPFGQLSMLGGYSKKEFGAYDFYPKPGTHMPSREWTQTGYVNMSLSYQFPSVKLIPRLSYRRHIDRYMEDQLVPNNVSNHTTNVLQGELVILAQLSENTKMTGGMEIMRDDIVSNVYGTHQRLNGGAFASIFFNTHPWTFDGSLRLDAHSDYGYVVCPTLGIGYLLSGRGKFYMTVGRAFRAPTYTELYIHSSSNLGDPKLKPEFGWTYEIGSTYVILSSFHTSVAFFQHDQKDLIDYVRFSSSDTIYHAVNFTRARTRGIELSARWDNDRLTNNENGLQHLLISYGYLDSHTERDSIFAARYSFIHPRHQIAFSAIGVLPFSLVGSIGVVHKIRLSGKQYTLVDAHLAKKIDFCTISISGTNLFNQSYEEIAGVPLPGRWLWAGVEIKIL